ncbi:hypothetical protein ACE7GA_03070 [Roseomonas sp. CCTCC AB2023176]|uniref:hypothetical protein n=1 Tax=Roseomonas sp. CCTCC AB2023176 TaxID=3342640 RepID=UPI0035E3B759
MLEPLSGRLMVARLDDAKRDLPGAWRRAGCRVLGPFAPGAPRPSLPWITPFSCVALCRALLGPDAPFAVTPFGLYRHLILDKTKFLTSGKYSS